MKLLHLVTRDLGDTEKAVIEIQCRSSDCCVIDVRVEKDYLRLVDRIAECDKVFSW